MSDFNWHTEDEDAVWDAQEMQPTPTTARPRQWLGLVLIILLTAAAATWFAIQVRSRIDTAVSEAEADVLTTQQLLFQAAEAQDPELFTNLLSGRDPDWAIDQRSLLETGLLFDRPFLGLRVELTPTAPTTITLSPDLTEADVILNLPYRSQHTGRQVMLQHQLVYRRGESRWLLAPPDTDRYAETETLRGRYLQLTFPTADRDIANRLFSDLDSALDTICHSYFDINCPQEMQVSLTFTADPLSLITANELPPPPLDSLRTLTITLPTPSLTGLPLDEAAYTHLYQGYASTLLSDQMTALISRYWQAYPDMIRIGSQKRLAQHNLAAPPTNFSIPDFRVPTHQDIALLCYSDNGLELGRYRPADNSYTAELAGHVLVRLEPAPNGRHIAITQRDPTVTGDRTSVILWDTANRTVIHTLSALPRVSQIVWRSQSELHVVQSPTVSGAADGAVHSLTPEVDCSAPDCGVTASIIPFDGIPSADGRWTLISQAGEILLGNASSEPITPIGSGSRPFWLDERRFAYIQSLNPQDGPVVFSLNTASVDSPHPTQLLHQDQIIAALPEELRPQELLIAYAQTNPAKPDQLLILTLALDGPAADTAFLFLFDTTTGDLHQTLASNTMYSFELAADSRTLYAITRSEDNSHFVIHLYDMRTEETQQHSLHSSLSHINRASWSAAGDWLLVLADGVLHLLHPATGKLFRTQPAGNPYCFDAVWIHAS